MRSLERRIKYVWIAYWFIGSLILGSIGRAVDTYYIDSGFYLGILVFFLFFVFGSVYSIFRYKIWGYEVRDDSLYLKRGVFTRVKTIVPYARIQHVDTQRSVLERILNLSTLVVYTAGSRGSDVNIPGLDPEHAENLQKQLKEKTTEFELGEEDAV
ncbi:putative membrane protein YdbS containing bPH2 domain [Methanonatronarchaeum thermophilum]|uniref:Putative membrane protein YdbS containing bPH2 domain n=1 Tax=Methanonatronarchaeum thermophilum TaxID=1927129 RepID=A0A1Y3GD74_9EURY|nr:PH domain-containing protein [Methanonatronarchaeum thermophilum]OUJ19401.1 putative membrane protein YdbS containing bPH2 domain [Methanonatronarchaeum thermophilum]